MSSAPRGYAPPDVPCLDDNALAQFANGLLGPEEIAQVDEHLDGCGHCREAVALLKQGDAVPLGAEADDIPSTEVRGVKGPGDVLDGKWKLEAKLGEGGMGIVYLARDLELDRRVAIKVLSGRGGALSPDLLSRFEREAKLMARLEHPNLVPVYAVGWRGPTPFIVMKFLEGMTLSSWADQLGHRLGLRELLPLARQLCDGLGFMHASGFIHRDVKPANIYVSSEGHVTLLDLGIARPQRDSNLTKLGLMLGTPRYMAPEQITARELDPRADLYSLGAVFYELLTGEAPFDGPNDDAVMLAHLQKAPPDASLRGKVSPAVGKLLQRALAKLPADRFQSAAELYEALQRAASAAEGPSIIAPLADDAFTGPPPTVLDTNVTRLAQATGEREAGEGPERATPDARARGGDGPPVDPSALDPGPSVQSSPTLPVVAPTRIVRAVAPRRWVLGAGVVLAIGVAGAAAGLSALRRPTRSPPPAVAPVAPLPRADLVEADAVEAEVVDAGGDAVASAPGASIAGTAPGPGPRASPPPRRPGQLLVTVTSGGALLWAWVDVDGVRRGTSPTTVDVAAGKHVVRVSRPGFREVSREVMVRAGSRSRVQLDLVAQ